MTNRPKAIIGIDVAGRTGVCVSLESLPALLGHHDYADLCEVMKLTDWSREQLPTGEEFARYVRDEMFRIRHRRQSEREAQKPLAL